MQHKSFTFLVNLILIFLFGETQHLNGQISVVPNSCYPGVTAAEQDAAAASSNGETPFATWKGAYDYAIAHSITEINFAAGTYFPGGASGTSDRWGDANGGFDLVGGMTVNGNGAVIDNSANSNNIAFATIASSNASINGFTFIQFTGNNAGAVRVNSGTTGWSINDCNFDGCDWAGDGLSILGGTGTISYCNFYNHTRSTGSALTITSGNITIDNSVFSCNSRIVAGGAVRVLGGSTEFNNCTFDGNITNSASGGAISIESGAIATMNDTKFTCNMANVNTQDDGGAINLIGSASLYLNGCTFQGNVAKDRGGAIHASGAAVLNITNTTFSGNSTNTASTSKGGAIFMNDVADNDISGSYFTNNSVSGEGGGVYIAAGSGGNYNFIDNTFVSNSASGACTGIDIFTERHITGSNNDLQYLADGHHLSNSPGSLQFTGLAIAGTQLAGNPVYDSETVTMTAGLPLYWSTTMYTTGLNSAARMAYVLSGNNSDFTQGSGVALVFRRYSSTDCDLEFVSYSGGVDGTLTTLATLVNTAAVSGSFAIKTIYNNGTWTFNVTNSGTSSELTQDPRGFRYCNSVATGSSGLMGSNVGFFWQHSSTISSVYAQFGDSYFRAGDETTGSGGSGSGLAAACSSCITSTAASPTCPPLATGSIQGDVFLDANLNGINNSGESLEDVLIELLDNLGNVVATTTTDANGHYVFNGLTTGIYQVRFGVPPGYNQATSTSQNTGGPNIDSDITPSSSGPSFLSPIINLNTGTGMSNGNDDFNNAANFFNVGAGYQAIILPVTWTSMTVDSRDCQNILQWTTASETNNNYFEIQKSRNGNDFYTIGQIKGEGDKKEVSGYTFTDIKNVGFSSYYRVKQVDFDGKYNYSSIVKSSPNLCLRNENDNVIIYPNPIHNDIVNIVFDGFDPEFNMEINIYNQVGALVINKSIKATALNNNVQISTENLPSGLYNLNVVQTGSSHSFQNIKFIKI